MPDFILEDAEEAERESPYGFRIPPREVRESLDVGDFAELAFIEGSRGERLWVEVAEIMEDPPVFVYLGALAEPPKFLRSIDRGELVAFQPRHVTDVRQAPAIVRNGAVLGKKKGKKKEREEFLPEIFSFFIPPEMEEEAEPEPPRRETLRPGARPRAEKERKEFLPEIFSFFIPPEMEEEPTEPPARAPERRRPIPAEGRREWRPAARQAMAPVPSPRTRTDPSRWFDLPVLWERARTGRRTAAFKDALRAYERTGEYASVPLQIVAETGRDQEARAADFFGVNPEDFEREKRAGTWDRTFGTFIADLERVLNEAMPEDLGNGVVAFRFSADGDYGLFFLEGGD